MNKSALTFRALVTSLYHIGLIDPDPDSGFHIDLIRLVPVVGELMYADSTNLI